MKKLGIITALPAEAKCFQAKKINFKSPIEIERNIFLCISGIGYKSSLYAANELIKLNVDALISWGIAGATCDLVNTGDLILAKAVKRHKNIYKTSNEWCKKIIYHFQGSSLKILNEDIVSTEEICSTPVKKMNLFKKTKASVVDMESAAMAEVAMTNNLDFIIVRAIADNAILNKRGNGPYGFQHYHYFCEELWRIYHRLKLPNCKIYQEVDKSHKGYGGSIIVDDEKKNNKSLLEK